MSVSPPPVAAGFRVDQRRGPAAPEPVRSHSDVRELLGTHPRLLPLPAPLGCASAAVNSDQRDGPELILCYRLRFLKNQMFVTTNFPSRYFGALVLGVKRCLPISKGAGAIMRAVARGAAARISTLNRTDILIIHQNQFQLLLPDGSVAASIYLHARGG